MTATSYLDAAGFERHVSPASPLPVDIQGATLSLDADGVEIKNDSGNPVPVDDGGGSITVDGKAYRSTVSFARPSNTTAYVAGDVIGATGSAIHTLTSAGPSGGLVLVQGVELLIDAASVPAGMGSFRVHFYNASPTAIADNAAFDLVSGDRAAYLGYVTLGAPQDLGSTIYSQTEYTGRLIKLASASTTLYAQLETRNGFTPASGTTYELRVNTLEAGL